MSLVLHRLVAGVNWGLIDFIESFNSYGQFGACL